jgi:uncharacterized damage-inducible protein DinB
MQTIELIGYNHTVRRLYFEAMAKLPWRQVIESKGLSFDSMRNVFLHLTLVEDRWISYVIPDRFSRWVDLDFDDFQDPESLSRYMQQTQSNTEKYRSNLSSEELSRQIVIPWGERPNTRISIETALTHMVLEDMIHYGELSAALWQMGLDAPYIGFWRYKYQNLNGV